MRLIEAGKEALGAPNPLEVVVTTTPQRTRGCAIVGGNKVVLAVAPPSRFSKAKLARILRHELWHTLGYEHEGMPEYILYSEGPEPEWATGIRVRYRKRGESVNEELE